MKVHSPATQLKLSKVYSEHEINSLSIIICSSRKILVVWENCGHSSLPQRGLTEKSVWRHFWGVHLLWNRKKKHRFMPSANLMLFSAQLGNNHYLCTKPTVWSLSLAVQKTLLDFDRLLLWGGFARSLFSACVPPLLVAEGMGELHSVSWWTPAYRCILAAVCLLWDATILKGIWYRNFIYFEFEKCNF